MSSREIRIATRKSALALWQAEHVREHRELVVIELEDIGPSQGLCNGFLFNEWRP